MEKKNSQAAAQELKRHNAPPTATRASTPTSVAYCQSNFATLLLPVATRTPIREAFADWLHLPYLLRNEVLRR